MLLNIKGIGKYQDAQINLSKLNKASPSVCMFGVTKVNIGSSLYNISTLQDCDTALNNIKNFTGVNGHNSSLIYDYLYFNNDGLCAFTVGGSAIGATGSDVSSVSCNNIDFPTTVTTTDKTTYSHGLGVNIKCDFNGDPVMLNYPYNGFDVSIDNSCSNANKTFVVFTPQSGLSGDVILGGYPYANVVFVIAGFTISGIEKQHGDFYLKSDCGNYSYYGLLGFINTSLLNVIIP